MPERCPACDASFQGDPIPEEDREAFGGKTHFSRALYHNTLGNGPNYWVCPDCDHRWTTDVR